MGVPKFINFVGVIWDTHKFRGEYWNIHKINLWVSQIYVIGTYIKLIYGCPKFMLHSKY